MGKKKPGLLFFYRDCDQMRQRDIRRILKNQGYEGYAIYSMIEQQIYGFEGYYMLIDDDMIFDLADDLKSTEGKVNELIDYCIEIGVFDKAMFEKYKILTSEKIQAVYAEANKRREFHIEDCYKIVSKSEERANEARKIIEQSRILKKEDSDGITPDQIIDEIKVVPKMNAHDAREYVNKYNGQAVKLCIKSGFYNFANLYDKQTKVNQAMIAWLMIDQGERNQIFIRTTDYVAANKDPYYRMAMVDFINGRYKEPINKPLEKKKSERKSTTDKAVQQYDNLGKLITT